MTASPALIAARAQATAQSLSATILAVVTTLGGLIVGLGVISSEQDGIIIAVTTASLGAVGAITAAIHSHQINPSALQASILAVVTQGIVLAVSFALISNATAGLVLSVTSAVLLAAVQIAHAIFSRQVLPPATTVVPSIGGRP